MTALDDIARAAQEIARPVDEWRDEHGDVLWWEFDEEGRPTEAPWVGSPHDAGYPVTCTLLDPNGTEIGSMVAYVGGWPDYHTHWTPLPPTPARPTKIDRLGRAERQGGAE